MPTTNSKMPSTKSKLTSTNSKLPLSRLFTPALIDKKKTHQVKYVHRSKFNIYIKDVLRVISPDASISLPAVEIVDSLLKKTFEDVSNVAKDLLTKKQKRTLDEFSVESALKTVLHGDLLSQALAVGSQAVRKFHQGDRAKEVESAEEVVKEEEKVPVEEVVPEEKVVPVEQAVLTDKMAVPN